MEILLGKKAFQDIQDLETFYEEKDLNFFVKLLIIIKSNLNVLGRYPEIGKNLGKNRRLMIVPKTTLIFTYTILDEKQILVLRIFDTRQNPQKLFT